jgi:hypothetical protein
MAMLFVLSSNCQAREGMMKKLLWILILLCTTLFIPSLSLTQESSLPSLPKTKVNLVVECDDEQLKAETKSFMLRELRSLGDTTYTSIDPLFTIEINLFQIESKSGKKGPIAVSYVFFRNYKTDHLAEACKDVVKTVLSMDKLFTDLSSGLIAGSRDDLDQACRAIVVSFDSQYLQRKRDFYQQFNDFTESAEKK